MIGKKKGAEHGKDKRDWQATNNQAKLPTWPSELPLLPPAHRGNHGNASPRSTATIRGAMADAVIDANSQGQSGAGSHSTVCRPHRSPPTDDDAGAGELRDPRRLSLPRARPFATPEKPGCCLLIRAARPSSGSGWIDRDAAERNCAARRGAGIWWV